MRIDVVVIRIPKPGEEVIKGSDSGGIAYRKATENGIQWIDFKLCGPLGNRSNFKGNGKKIRTLHAGGSSGNRTILGIFAFQHLICVRKIKIPETVNDIPDITGNGIRVRIIFTNIFNNKVLLVRVAATVNR